MESTFTPEPAQIALALAVIKLKPAGSDIREFTLQLRDSIKTSKTAEVFHFPDKFFDSVSFWRQAYEKSEAEKSKLLDRIFELEQLNDDLVAKSHQEEVKSETLPVEEREILEEHASRKRPIAIDHLARKRPRKQLYSLKAASATDLKGLYNVLGQTETSRRLPLIRQSYTLSKVLKKRADSTSIIQAAIILCRTCGDELVAAVSSEISEAKLKKGALSLSLVLSGIEPAISLLLKALGKLSGNKSSKQVGMLIYNLVHLYETTLSYLRQYCKAHATPINPIRTDYSVLTRSKTARQPKPSIEPDDHVSKDEGAIQLALLLHIMVKSLDLKCPAHQKLLEGFLYVLLGRAGKTLCLFVFQDLQLEPDLRTSPQDLPLPAGLMDAELDGKSLGAAQGEAKYIVFLLRKALALLHQQPTAPSDDSSHAQFLSKIKTQIQDSLLQAVFGADPEFGESLKPPTKPRDSDIRRLVERGQPSDSSIPEWYIQELWQLLGWEALEDFNVL
ncbi:hypothetical protein BDV18DRAFT_63809 [Aspergillus unguis]